MQFSVSSCQALKKPRLASYQRYRCCPQLCDRSLESQQTKLLKKQRFKRILDGHLISYFNPNPDIEWIQSGEQQREGYILC